jgi:hypothetical protein
MPAGFVLLDFWRWSASDLLSHATRGVLAEYIVAQALGAVGGVPRREWDAYDLTTPLGVRVEVKSAAYVQSWPQTRPSAIRFGVRGTVLLASDGTVQDPAVRRRSDIYVFALLAHKDRATLDPLDLGQWLFDVVATAVLDARLGAQKWVSLKTLGEVAGPGIGFSRLRLL